MIPVQNYSFSVASDVISSRFGFTDRERSKFLSISDQVSTPMHVFSGCLRLEQKDGERVRMVWFANGIGLVKTEIIGSDVDCGSCDQKILIEYDCQ